MIKVAYFLLLISAGQLVLAHLSPNLVAKYGAEVLNEGRSSSLPPPDQDFDVQVEGRMLCRSNMLFMQGGVTISPSRWNNSLPFCLYEAVKELSLGDSVRIICPYETAYGVNGKGWVPPLCNISLKITRDPQRTAVAASVPFLARPILKVGFGKTDRTKGRKHD